MKMKCPQPNQTFWHVGPEGHVYTSDEHNIITPLNHDDVVALRLLNCVDVGDNDTPQAAEESSHTDHPGYPHTASDNP